MSLITTIVNNKNKYKGVYRMNPITSGLPPLTDYYVSAYEKPSKVLSEESCKLQESFKLQELAIEIAAIAASPSAIVNISPQAIRALEQAVNNL
jgi:hypothetical protein